MSIANVLKLGVLVGVVVGAGYLLHKKGGKMLLEAEKESRKRISELSNVAEATRLLVSASNIEINEADAAMLVRCHAAAPGMPYEEFSILHTWHANFLAGFLDSKAAAAAAVADAAAVKE